MITSLRSAATEARYRADIAAGRTRPLDKLPTLIEWNHWRLASNDYPYDAAFGVHDLLIIKRDSVAERWGLNDAEKNELDEIMRTYVYPIYHTTFETVPSRRSAPQRYHLHVARFYASRDQMKL